MQKEKKSRFPHPRRNRECFCDYAPCSSIARISRTFFSGSAVSLNRCCRGPLQVIYKWQTPYCFCMGVCIMSVRTMRAWFTVMVWNVNQLQKCICRCWSSMVTDSETIATMRLQSSHTSGIIIMTEKKRMIAPTPGSSHSRKNRTGKMAQSPITGGQTNDQKNLMWDFACSFGCSITGTACRRSSRG